MTDIVGSAFAESAAALEALRNDAVTQRAIVAAGEAIARALLDGGRAFSCGNGGSFCDALHFAEELLDGTGRIDLR